MRGAYLNVIFKDSVTNSGFQFPAILRVNDILDFLEFKIKLKKNFRLFCSKKYHSYLKASIGSRLEALYAG